MTVSVLTWGIKHTDSGIALASGSLKLQIHGVI